MKPLPPLMPLPARPLLLQLALRPASVRSLRRFKACAGATATLALLATLLPGSAHGQVSVDMHALDSPGATQPAPVRRLPARPAPVRHLPAHRVQATTEHSTTATNGNPRTNHAPDASRLAEDHTAPKPTAAPGVTPPSAAPVSAPVPALPTQQPAPPPASTIVPAPATNPMALPPPVRLVFEAGKTDLTPADEAAIQDLARAIPQLADDSVNVVAYAAGKPDDPSTARRVSLSRGLAVRSVLLASGVPSAQIYVRALGSTPSNGPADRVELIVAPIGTVVTR